MYVVISRLRSASALKEISVLLSVKLMKVMVRGLSRCVHVYMFIYICCVYLIFVRIRKVSVTKKKRNRLVIVLVERRLRYVEC